MPWRPSFRKSFRIARKITYVTRRELGRAKQMRSSATMMNALSRGKWESLMWLSRIALRDLAAGHSRFVSRLWSKVPGEAAKRILLVTDIPPCTNYTGGIFTGEMLESVGLTIKDIFVLLDPYVKPHVPSALKQRLNMRIEAKPIEQYHPGGNPEHSESRIRYLERLNTEHIQSKTLPSLLKFAARSRASAFGSRTPRFYAASGPCSGDGSTRQLVSCKRA